jgi:peptidoglycan-N-acetylglucosamine deacetylase
MLLKTYIQIGFVVPICILACKPKNTTTNTTPTVTDSSNITFIKKDTTATKRTVYLTFDDGPNLATPTIINILNEQKVPATFFLIGLHYRIMPNSKAITQQLRNMPNVELANHSYTHGYSNHYDRFYRDSVGCLADFNKCVDSIGFKSNVVRTPGNNIWRTTQFKQTSLKRYTATANYLFKNGYRILGWDVEWRYLRGNRLLQTSNNLKLEIDNMFATNQNHSTNNCVLLMHDLNYLDAKDSTSLVNFIQLVKADTLYRFDIVANHPFIKN